MSCKSKEKVRVNLSSTIVSSNSHCGPEEEGGKDLLEVGTVDIVPLPFTPPIAGWPVEGLIVQLQVLLWQDSDVQQEPQSLCCCPHLCLQPEHYVLMNTRLLTPTSLFSKSCVLSGFNEVCCA